MDSPRQIAIKNFTYDLPEQRIARFPLEERDQSKLLIYQSGAIAESRFSGIADFLPKGTNLVLNNTRVVNARLHFSKSTGGRVEIFCLNPHEEEGDVSQAFQKKGRVKWMGLIGGAKKWKEGPLEMRSQGEEGELMLRAEKGMSLNGKFEISFSWSPVDMSFAEVLARIGNLPLPPYLNRDADEFDKKRYQTVFAEHEGSVAAPTASLHFTEELLDSLEERGVRKHSFTLHVGAGTFKPVSVEKIGDHEMHYEHFNVSLQFLKGLRMSIDNPVVAVGTTSLRTLESLFWLSEKINTGNITRASELNVFQWDPYEIRPSMNTSDALDVLINFAEKNDEARLIGKTQLMIAPGYRFRFADGLITNFHQPNSTLLLLVAAFVGCDWKRIYEYALHNDFRFLSYGDGSLLWRTK